MSGVLGATPGPWVESGFSDWYPDRHEGAGDTAWVNIRSDSADHDVAIVMAKTDWLDDGAAIDANAALIIAVHDLYEQGEQSAAKLDEAANVLEAKGSPHFATLCRDQAVRQRAALSKARGE